MRCAALSGARWGSAVTLRSAALRLYSSSSASSGGPSPKYFDKVLIANRGEIACRVMRTCRRLGIQTVAVFSEPDRESMHAKMADEAVCVGPAASSESYLRMDRILEAVQQTGAQAVHPGYGFLSENTEFAKKLEEMGVAFIGPGSFAIDAMGDKIHSKKIATEAGVNIIPGFVGEVTESEAVRISNEIGYPVMLKAAAGGGGKGMRVAWNDEEAKEGFRLSQQEARSSFGDDRMLIEKFIDNPRHIEVQMLADGQGTTLYLPERECSIQRRNQKVVEEAPSPFIDPETRKAMGEQARALADAVQYRSAGTVEFLVDSQKKFYFLEMNTRLQVEHPITEYVTGLDLVEQMIRVAAGNKLELTQDDVQLKGWAIESRVYAEDPLKGFLPSIGRLDRYVEPSMEDGNVRCDTGVKEGSMISMYYDPLISKLCSYGATREEAIARMKKALDTYTIRGPRNNLNFLREVMDHPRFVSGDYSTKFIEEEYEDGFKGYNFKDEDRKKIAISTAVMHAIREKRLNALEGKLPSAASKGESSLQLFVGFPDSAETLAEQKLMELDGSDDEVLVQPVARIPNGYRVQMKSSDIDVNVWPSQRAAQLKNHLLAKKKLDQSMFLSSPMPGTVLSINVKPGDKVYAGQEVAVLEAMKMQNVLRAEKDTVVKQVKVGVGKGVAVDEILIEYEE